MARFHCPVGDHTVDVKPVKGTMQYDPATLFCPTHQARLETGMQRNAKRNAGRSLRTSESLAEARARQAFQSIVCDWPCWARDHRKGHECWGRKDGHHLLPLSWLRQHFGDIGEAEFLAIAFNPIIGAPACRRFHEGLENRSEIIHFHELDDELKVFCQRIDERYPSRPSMLERLKLESPPLSPKKEGERV